MKEALESKRERFQVELRRKRISSIVRERRCNILAILDQQRQLGKATIEDAVDHLHQSIYSCHTEGVLEAVQSIAQFLHRFDYKKAAYLLNNNVLETLLTIHCSPLSSQLKIDREVLARNRTLYVISRISHLDLLTESTILKLGLVQFVLGELQMSNPLKFKYILNFFSNVLCLPGVYAEAVSRDLLPTMITSVNDHLEWYQQLRELVIWFGFNYLQSTKQFQGDIKPVQVAELEEFAKDVINSSTNCEEQISELTTLLDALRLSLLARELHLGNPHIYSMGALTNITISTNLTGEHRRNALCLIESLVQQSDVLAAELQQDSSFFNRALGGNVNQPEQIAHLKIIETMVWHFRIRYRLQDFTTELSKILYMIQEPKVRDATLDYLFSYFEANEYKIDSLQDSNGLDRMAESSVGHTDQPREIEFWFQILLTNGELAVPAYVSNSHFKCQRLDYIVQHCINI